MARRGGWGARTPTTCALQTFTASRSVTIPVEDCEAFAVHYPLDRYLQDCDRVVHMTFPDKDRRMRLKKGLYKIQMLPLQFFALNFKPSVKVTTFFEEGALQLRVTDLAMDGIPPDLINMETVKLEVAGGMAPVGGAGGEGVSLTGSVSISLTADVPEPFNSAPGLHQVTEGILDGVIGSMEDSLVRGIVKDYKRWGVGMTRKAAAEAKV